MMVVYNIARSMNKLVFTCTMNSGTVITTNKTINPKRHQSDMKNEVNRNVTRLYHLHTSGRGKYECATDCFCQPLGIPQIKYGCATDCFCQPLGIPQIKYGCATDCFCQPLGIPQIKYGCATDCFCQPLGIPQIKYGCATDCFCGYTSDKVWMCYGLFLSTLGYTSDKVIKVVLSKAGPLNTSPDQRRRRHELVNKLLEPIVP